MFPWSSRFDLKQLVETRDLPPLREARTLIAKGLSVHDATARLKVGKTTLYGPLKLPTA